MTRTNQPFRILLTIAFAVGISGVAHATSTLLGQFNTRYGTSGTVLDTCSTCHTANIPSLNPYGTDFLNSGFNFQAIENIDSDGDGFTNLQEIMALTFPGDPNSHPPVGPPDTTAPTVTAFTLPATFSSLTVPITSFTATDNVGVTGYLVTESSTAPAANAAGWTSSAPTSFTFATQGMQTVFGWAKDAAGNVSAGISATVDITLTGGGGGDTTPPVVTSFTLPATSTSNTVQILSFTATDDVGVTGYLVTATSRTPRASSTRWQSTPPASFRFRGHVSGSVSLFAWAKDAAGNVSAPATATTVIGSSGVVEGTDDSEAAGSVESGEDSGVGGSGADSAENGSGMDMWVSQWFNISIRNNAQSGAAGSGYLKIQSWNSDTSMLQATLFTQNESGRWQSVDLELGVSGSPLRLLASFDHANEFQFAASINAAAAEGRLTAATLQGVGISSSLNSASPDGSAANSSAPLFLAGKLVSATEVPSQILH